MGKLSRVIFIFVIIIVVLFAGKNIIGKFVVEKGVKAATGLPLEMKEFDIGIASTHIGIRGLSLFNPTGFSDRVMFHAPEIFVDYNLGAIVKGKIHLEDVRLNFDRLVIVKNKDGQVNIDVLKSDKKKTPGEKAKKPSKKKKGPSIQIDRLMVKVGKVIYKDYSTGPGLAVKEFNVNVSQEYKNITNSKINWLVLSIVQKALLKTTLSSLADFNLDVISNAADVSTQAVGALKEVPKQAVDTLKEVPKQAVDTLKGAADTLKDTIKLPFGSN